MAIKRVQEIEAVRERVASIRGGEGETALYLTTQELCPLIRLPKPTLNGWAAKGWLTPAVKGAGGRNHPSYWNGWQCVGLAVVAHYHDEARAKGSYLTRAVIDWIMQSFNENRLEELYQTVKPDDAWREEITAATLAHLTPQMPTCDADKIDRISDVLLYLFGGALQRRRDEIDAPRIRGLLWRVGWSGPLDMKRAAMRIPLRASRPRQRGNYASNFINIRPEEGGSADSGENWNGKSSGGPTRRPGSKPRANGSRAQAPSMTAPAAACVATRSPNSILCGTFITDHTAVVGCCCVKRLGGQIGAILDAIKRVMNDPSKSLNAEAIELAHQRGWISNSDRGFYLNIIRPEVRWRALSERQQDWKEAINRKVLARMATGRGCEDA